MDRSWQVVRNCCTSGNCVRCIGQTRVGVPVRIVQQDGLTQERAKLVARNWGSYKAEAEAMEPAR